MSEAQALQTLETMPEQEFQNFLASLPERVKLLVKSGMSDWRQVLPQWYIKSLEPKRELTAEDIPW